jgi:hypothetical protein
MARTAKRYKKNTEKKISGIPVCMAAIYARLSVDNDEKKSESTCTHFPLTITTIEYIVKCSFIILPSFCSFCCFLLCCF